MIGLLLIASLALVYHFTTEKYSGNTLISLPHSSENIAEETLEVPIIGSMKFFNSYLKRDKFPVILGDSFNPDKEYRSSAVAHHASLYDTEKGPYLTLIMDKEKILEIMAAKNLNINTSELSGRFRYDSYAVITAESEEEKETIDQFSKHSTSKITDTLQVEIKDINEPDDPYSILLKYNRK